MYMAALSKDLGEFRTPYLEVLTMPLAPPCYLTTAILNDCYSELTAYTTLGYLQYIG